MVRQDGGEAAIRQQLEDVRRGLLRLHKALIDSERVVYEREHGAMSSGQFLQALLNEPFFAWLRPYSTLIAEIDAALAEEEAVSESAARTMFGRVLALIAQPEVDEARARYEEVCRRDPGVLFAHIDLTRRLAAAAG